MIKNCKILMLKNKEGTETMGLVTAHGILDVRSVAQKLKIQAPLTLDQLLQEDSLDSLQQVIDQAPRSGIAYLDESKIRYGRLFRKPGKILCVGLNYKQHADEVGMARPNEPPLFNKFNNSLSGHLETITLPSSEISTKFDYETELLIVIGKAMRNVPENEALNYVAGYCTANDFSARDLQLEKPSGQWLIGKTLDQFAPIGPYFVTADLVGDPNNLSIKTYVNGELRQNSNTSDFIFTPQQILSYISRYWTLDPGDIIFTGTPQGVILGMPKDKQVWLKKGDVIVSSIEKLGDLKFSLA